MASGRLIFAGWVFQHALGYQKINLVMRKTQETFSNFARMLTQQGGLANDDFR